MSGGCPMLLRVLGTPRSGELLGRRLPRHRHHRLPANRATAESSALPLLLVVVVICVHATYSHRSSSYPESRMRLLLLNRPASSVCLGTALRASSRPMTMPAATIAVREPPTSHQAPPAPVPATMQRLDRLSGNGGRRPPPATHRASTPRST